MIVVLLSVALVLAGVAVMTQHFAETRRAEARVPVRVQARRMRRR